MNEEKEKMEILQEVNELKKVISEILKEKDKIIPCEESEIENSFEMHLTNFGNDTVDFKKEDKIRELEEELESIQYEKDVLIEENEEMKIRSEKINDSNKILERRIADLIEELG